MDNLNEKLSKDEIISFDDMEYRVLDSHIVTGADKVKLMFKLNIAGLVLIIFMLLAYVFISAQSGEFTIEFLDIILALAGFVLFIVYIFFHEFIHGITYIIFGKVKKDKLKYGFSKASMVAYCISTVPVSIRASRLSLMMPLYICVLPLYIIGLIYSSFILVFISALFASGSVGDIWYMWTLRKTSRSFYMIEKLPNASGYDLGYYLLEKL